MLGWEADLKSIDSHVIEFIVYLVVISKYLFKYVFKVSPSHMDKDSSESRGRETLLHVIK